MRGYKEFRRKVEQAELSEEAGEMIKKVRDAGEGIVVLNGNKAISSLAPDKIIRTGNWGAPTISKFMESFLDIHAPMNSLAIGPSEKQYLVIVGEKKRAQAEFDSIKTLFDKLGIKIDDQRAYIYSVIGMSPPEQRGSKPFSSCQRT
ncbi:MAG: hypothetical protein KGH65_02755 [Candidatus Micrarchaeota archaeon]|nr:hypothetical protein [Candidatus Micrarchaeota archaeon]